MHIYQFLSYSFGYFNHWLDTTTNPCCFVINAHLDMLQSVKPEQKQMPACTRIRLKIMPYILKARESANAFPYNIQVLRDRVKIIVCRHLNTLIMVRNTYHAWRVNTCDLYTFCYTMYFHVIVDLVVKGNSYSHHHIKFTVIPSVFISLTLYDLCHAVTLQIISGVVVNM